MHYLPGIIWIPCGLRKREQLVVHVGPFFQRMNVRHVAAEVTGLENGGRRVLTSAGAIDNDALVIASGGRFIKSCPGSSMPSHRAKALQPQRRFAIGYRPARRHHRRGFAGNPNEPTAVRGGPMSEFLFGIDDKLRREGRRDRFQLVFFNPATEPGNRLGSKAVQHLLSQMRARGITTYLGHKMQRFEANKVVTEGSEFAQPT